MINDKNKKKSTDIFRTQNPIESNEIFKEDIFKDLELFEFSFQNNYQIRPQRYHESNHYTMKRINSERTLDQSFDIQNPQNQNKLIRQTSSSPSVNNHSNYPQNILNNNFDMVKSFPTLPTTTYQNILKSKYHENNQAKIANMHFFSYVTDPSYILSPKELGLIPSSFWNRCQSISFGDLVRDFFQKKNSINCRFLHKLYNALIISEKHSTLTQIIGVTWINDKILKVDKQTFGRLIGIKSLDNSLFHQQGNFPSHGFLEISSSEVTNLCPGIDLIGIDFDNIRLVYHSNNLFIKGCTEDLIETCKWTKQNKLY